MLPVSSVDDVRLLYVLPALVAASVILLSLQETVPRLLRKSSHSKSADLEEIESRHDGLAITLFNVVRGLLCLLLLGLGIFRATVEASPVFIALAAFYVSG